MLAIRLLRTGRKNQPFFKIVVTDKKNPPVGGRFVEEVGYWNPLTKERKLNKERIQYWLSVGAKPSDTVYNFLVSEDIIKGKKIPLHKTKKKKKEKAATTEKAETPEQGETPEKAAEEKKETGEEKTGISEKTTQEKEATKKEKEPEKAPKSTPKEESN